MWLVATSLDSAVTEDVSQKLRVKFFKHCCCSVTQSCLTLCYPMECSTLGLSVPHHLPKFAQVHVDCIGDAIPLSHPLTPSLPSVLSLSQHRELFQWVNCSHQMTKILEFQLQHQSSQRVGRLFLSLWKCLFLPPPQMIEYEEWGNGSSRMPLLLLLSHFSCVRLCVIP